jgi:hypothetical protein
LANFELFRGISSYFGIFRAISAYFGIKKFPGAEAEPVREMNPGKSWEIVQNRGKSYQIKMDQAAIKPGA